MNFTGYTRMEVEDFEPNPVCFEPQVIVKCEKPDYLDFTESIWIKHEKCDEEEAKKIDDSEGNFVLVEIKQELNEEQSDLYYNVKDGTPQVDQLKVEPRDFSEEIKEELNIVNDQKEDELKKQYDSTKVAKRKPSRCEVAGCAESDEDHAIDLSTDAVAIKQQSDNKQAQSCKRKTALNCGVCQFVAKTRRGLRDHKATHESKPFKCPACAYSAARASSLKRHLFTHSGDKPHKCHVCPYSTIQPCDLKKHLASHVGLKPFRCELCTYSGPHASNLRAHMLTHSAVKRFRCTVCEYGTNWSSHLKLHMTSHTQERSYKCPLCPYDCTSAALLKRHMSRHTGGNPFKCVLCSYNTCHPAHLMAHVARHTGDKFFCCKECPFKGEVKQDLVRHRAAAHRRSSGYSCAHCKFSAAYKSELKRHLNTH